MERNRRSNRKQRIPREPSANSLNYTGRIIYPAEKTEKHTTTLVLSDYYTLASTVGGVIADVFDSSPAPSSQWGDATAVWSEFRVLGHEIEFLPQNRYSKTTTTCAPGLGVLDRRSATALATFSTAESYESVRRLSLEDPWTMRILMNGAEESAFVNVGAVAAVNWIKLFFTGLTVSTTYGQILHRWRVQFRSVA